MCIYPFLIHSDSSLLVEPKVRTEIALQDHTRYAGFQILPEKVSKSSAVSRWGVSIYFRAIVMAPFRLVSEFRGPMCSLSAHPRDTLSFRHHYP